MKAYWIDITERFNIKSSNWITLRDAMDKYYSEEQQEIILKNLEVYCRNNKDKHFCKIIDKNLWDFKWADYLVKDILKFIYNWNELTEKQVDESRKIVDETLGL